MRAAGGRGFTAIALAALAVVLGLAPVTAASQGDDPEPLTIVSWGGVYQKSQREAYFEPFTEKTGIPIREEEYTGNFDAVIEQVESGNATWDLVDVTLADAIRGCENGYLEPIPPSILPPAPDGTPAMQDFLPNTLHECAVGEILWSTLWAYNRNAFSGEAPDSVEDVFDTQRFAGERGMRKTPRNNLEWALMADGVEPGNVYDELRTDAGVERAFARLDSIRGSIRWWESGSTPQEWLASGEVSLSTAYNGRVFNSIVNQGQPFEYIWDGQMWEIDLWVIPRGADNLANVLKFVAFATGTRPLAEQTEYVSYAPARKSSLPLVRSEYQPHMPTAPGNFRNALQNDFLWWAENQEEMDERFNAWLAEGDG
ncbi:MAG: ABC transporter substrate-binding protein [Halofilum sp. (in: g-proteobacteria)]|nr:ABC transporter substrate-binding protein [Halofilum sp. (in: g-proteobacteria)]